MKTDSRHPIDLLTATQDSLRRVPGIGETLARMIVEYRERLGGFTSVSQVLEAGNVPPEALECLYLSAVSVTKTDINRSSFQKLRRHPYISGEQAIAIIEARRKFRHIEGWHQLLRLPCFTPSDTMRLSPYTVF